MFSQTPGHTYPLTSIELGLGLGLSLDLGMSPGSGGQFWGSNSPALDFRVPGAPGVDFESPEAEPEAPGFNFGPPG